MGKRCDFISSMLDRPPDALVSQRDVERNLDRTYCHTDGPAVSCEIVMHVPSQIRRCTFLQFAMIQRRTTKVALYEEAYGVCAASSGWSGYSSQPSIPRHHATPGE